MSDSASPRAVLGEPLDELERRAEVVKQCIAAEEGYWRRSHDFTRVEAHQLAQATASAKAMLAAVCCTPERIAQLVALARQAEACWCGVYRCIHNDADAGHRFSTEHPRAPAGPGGENA